MFGKKKEIVGEEALIAGRDAALAIDAYFNGRRENGDIFLSQWMEDAHSQAKVAAQALEELRLCFGQTMTLEEVRALVEAKSS